MKREGKRYNQNAKNRGRGLTIERVGWGKICVKLFKRQVPGVCLHGQGIIGVV